mmetsp:Transcript_21641/g.60154  ORF Transcript_21641/g.60154 Transcript_21641/m.60154 type:complete len:217 (-) Transcript_21641:275-925(-)
MALRVEPSRPISRWRRLTNFSLLRMMLPILMMSHTTSSCRILRAWGAGTLRLSSLIRSRAFMMMKGSHILRVVRTVMEPSTRLSSQATPCSLRARVTAGHTSRKYFARYLGKRVAKELSSSREPPLLSSLSNLGMVQWSMPLWSQGLSFLYLPFFSDLCGLCCSSPSEPTAGPAAASSAMLAMLPTRCTHTSLHPERNSRAEGQGRPPEELRQDRS